MRENNKNKTIKDESQFGLLKVRRFAPFFWTQFFGAFNDNAFKNALILLIAYAAVRSSTESNILINLAAGLFILPFFLFSATAGQIADKYEKSGLIRKIKFAEIIIMALAAFAFYFQNVIILMILLFFMGTQSAFFGPVKYSILPQHLHKKEIIGGNAMVEMGTFGAILFGTIAGGVLSQVENGYIFIGLLIMLISVVGWLASRSIPEGAPDAPEIKFKWNLIKETLKVIRISRKKRSVFLSILGISWFWALGAVYLTQLPNFAKNILSSSEGVVTLLLTTFSIGIGIGSLLCERLSGKKVELGLVPFGSIGLSIFGIDLVFAYSTPHAAALLNVAQFMNTSGGLRVMFDFFMLGIFGGIYIVPLYAMIQTRTEKKYRARVIAANNIMNAVFMVIVSLAGVILLGIAGFTTPQFFLIMSICNIAIAVYIYTLVPEFVVRFIMWILSNTMYRFKCSNLDLIPDEGPAVLVCNHVSFVDSIFIAGSIRRPIRFVMHKSYYNIPVLKYIFRIGKVIPITSKKKDPETYKDAFKMINQALGEGELLCLFPEGTITRDGNINEFKPGIEKIIKDNPVPVIPLALRGLWGSFFSRKYGNAMHHFPRRFWSHIELIAGDPILPAAVNAEGLRDIVVDLQGNLK